MIEYKTFGGMSRHFAKLAMMGNEVTDAIAEQIATHIRDEAKAKLGEYQGASGPFGSWTRLAQATMDERVLLGFTDDEPLLRSGQLRDAIDSSLQIGGAAIGVPHGAHHGPRGEVEDVGDLAIRMEVGDGRTPPRPVLGPAAFESKHHAQQLAGAAVVAWLVGGNFLFPPQGKVLP